MTCFSHISDSSSYYAGLGALHDFSDPLLLYSFDRQVVCDPQNSPYYFECIQDIARGRKSEFLETRVMTLASEGHISRKDVDEAYTYFGIDPRHGPLLNDGHIIGLFQSRLPDIGRTQEGEMRQMLRTLGQVRNSYALDQAASECQCHLERLVIHSRTNEFLAIETYTQALAWLGVDDTMADEYMVPLLSLKVRILLEHSQRPRCDLSYLPFGG